MWSYSSTLPQDRSVPAHTWLSCSPSKTIKQKEDKNNSRFISYVITNKGAGAHVNNCPRHQPVHVRIKYNNSQQFCMGGFD